MAEVEDKLLGSDYDGIKEFDNPMPGWWIGLFIISIIWSAGYLLYYEVTGIGDTQIESYQQELAAAAERYKDKGGAGGDGNKVEIALMSGQSALSAGEKVFKTNCASCHGEQGQGLTGPNLADKYWIHGGDFKSIVKTIQEGVPEKGMIAWGPLLSTKEIVQVASYIDQEIKGTNPPDPKEPQGEVYEAEK